VAAGYLCSDDVFQLIRIDIDDGLDVLNQVLYAPADFIDEIGGAAIEIWVGFRRIGAGR
jgi:hypothetical protein